MDIDYKKSIGIIADYIIDHTTLELFKFNFILGKILEDGFRKRLRLSSLIEERYIEEIITTLRNIKMSPEKTKTAYAQTLTLVVAVDGILQSCPDLSKVMDDVNGKGVSKNVKKDLRYMKQTIA